MAESCFNFIPGGQQNLNADAIADIVFVHGITGDATGTWTHSNNEFWPSWIAADFPECNVYSIGYNSALFIDLIKGDGASLNDQASMMLDRLVSREKFERPVVFICHSLGGLIVKQLIRSSEGATNAKKRTICDCVKGIAFIATPHQGAQLASIVNAIGGVVTSKALKNLQYASDPLLDLGSWFSGYAVKKKIPISGYYETQKYKAALVVDKVSANPNILGCDITAVDEDHVSISKISSREKLLFVSISAFLRDALDGIKAGHSAQAAIDTDLNDAYTAFTTQANSDRQSLSEKLIKGDRVSEVSRAERQKESFSKLLNRNIAQPAAVQMYARLMSNIETRFNRFVVTAIASGVDRSTVDQIIQDQVIDQTVKSHFTVGETLSVSTVESAMYYLGGNCHLRWDNG
ncbi:MULTISPECIES: ABC-three component system protein [Asticcacaulis]|uniref:ABC-three component system protein n=1 Tax=Asticcacaulis TaxID=76890 RepID=UPI001AE30093|nr:MULTISPECIES: ABC-three component system protein [Asticcacaulis]MBP2159330.1 hypothetical protein [Asticcacaulis solisilvae]MDR6800375.1 hypothetical protein [Asticcacaulis sp. BE141]